jgi:hypothetical protein
LGRRFYKYAAPTALGTRSADILVGPERGCVKSTSRGGVLTAWRV